MAGCRAKTRLLAALSALIAGLAPQTALAHGMFNLPPGFMAGLLHPVLVPAQILPLAALGLLSGQNGLAQLKIAAPVLLISVLAGTGLAYTASTPPWFGLVPLGVALLIGLVVLVDWRLPHWALWTIAALVGLLVGLGQDVGGTAAESGRMAAGTLVTAVLLLAYLTALVSTIYREWPAWMQIGVRTIGSWIAAIAILIGGLYFIK